MNAILISVDYSDFLQITLPYNRAHFNRVLIVTSLADLRNVAPIAAANNAEVFATDAFYDNGAVFNKAKALEQGLDVLGRTGWICIMDADICWPRQTSSFPLETGNLYTPRRHMLHDLSILNTTDGFTIPPESTWSSYPYPRHEEFAGYTQIFHSSDTTLGPPPWHQTNWRHAGGADSFFQMKWPRHRQIRPPFECLHLGTPAANWMGRSTPLLDGTVLPQAEERSTKLRALWMSRKKYGRNYNNPNEKLM